MVIVLVLANARVVVTVALKLAVVFKPFSVRGNIAMLAVRSDTGRNKVRL
jgi:hypothetical protein